MKYSVEKVILMITFLLTIYFGNSMSEKNLTQITWDHAVNSQNLLNDALKSNIDMIEADIVLGTIIGDSSQKPIPIMGHPPANESDLSLNSFLSQIQAFNQNATKQKGVKLDFKSIEVFEMSVPILTNLYDEMSYPVWINADILPGPIDSQVTPVDSNRFLSGCKGFYKSILSIGWTTRYSTIVRKGTYTDAQIQNMFDVIKVNNVSQEITFPIRAGIAAQDGRNIINLVDSTKGSTVTFWSSRGDPVDVEAFRKLIFKIGLNRAYIDVPEELMKQLRLDEPC